MKKIKNNNSFLITCVSCIVLLLTLCYFGINTSLKGTAATSEYSCSTSGYSVVEDDNGNSYCCPNATDEIYTLDGVNYCLDTATFSDTFNSSYEYYVAPSLYNEKIEGTRLEIDTLAGAEGHYCIAYAVRYTRSCDSEAVGLYGWDDARLTDTNYAVRYDCITPVESCSYAALAEDIVANKVIIMYDTNGGTIDSQTTHSTYGTLNWTTDSNGIIKKNGENETTEVLYGKSTVTNGLNNYNNSSYINITHDSLLVKEGKEWVCLDGCTTKGKTFDQDTVYSSDDFCDASKGDCTVVLGVNWYDPTESACFLCKSPNEMYGPHYYDWITYETAYSASMSSRYCVVQSDITTEAQCDALGSSSDSGSDSGSDDTTGDTTTEKTYKYVFNLNGGTLKSGSLNQTCKSSAGFCSLAWNNVPTVEREDYTFNGWSTVGVDCWINRDLPAYVDTIYYTACWVKKGSSTGDTSGGTTGGTATGSGNSDVSKTYTATFNPNGGTLSGKSSLTCTTNSSSCTISSGLPSASKKDYTFTGWGTSSSCTSGNKNSVQLSNNKTFYACYTKNATGNTNTDSEGNVTTNSSTGEIAIALTWFVGLLAIGYSFYYFKNINKTNKN